MAIQVGDNFDHKSKKPLDGRISYATLALMKAVADANIYEGCVCYCVENDKYYKFLSTNTVDQTTGKWREYSSGGGGGSYTAGDGIVITNDEISTDNATAEDMEEIIPTLPSVMSRRFKYSTEEQIVGEWVDGKPVYQCTYDLNGMSVSTNFTDIGVSCADIDTLICGGSFVTEVKSGNNPAQSFPVTLLGYSGSHIVAGIGGGGARNVKYITIRYTKATD